MPKLVSTGILTIADVNDGADAVFLQLSSASITLPAANDGTVLSLVGAETVVTAMEGRVLGAGWVYGTPTKSSSLLTGTWSAAARTYTVTGFDKSLESAYVDFTATKNGTTLTTRYSLSKAKAGATGAAATTYLVEPSTAVVSRTYDSDNKARPLALWMGGSYVTDEAGSADGSARVLPVIAGTSTLTSPYMALAAGDYEVSFEAYTGDATNQLLRLDLFPDTLPESSVMITPTKTRYAFIWSSASADLSNCALRFWVTASAAAAGLRVYDVVLTKISQTGSVTFNAYSVTGTAARTAYPGRFVIATQSTAGVWTDRYTSAADQASYSYTPPVDVARIRSRLYLAGGVTTLVDEESIPVVANGRPGGAGTSLPKLSASGYHFAYDSSGTLKSADTLTFTLFGAGNTTASWTAIGYASATATTGTTLTLGGAAGTINRTLTSAQFAPYFRVEVVAVVGAYFDKTTIIRLADGVSALTATLSNPTAPVAASADGTVTTASLATASGFFKVRYGLQDVTADAVFSVVAGSATGGLVATIDNVTVKGAYTTTALSSDVGTVTFRATYNGVNLDQVFSVTRNRPGYSAVVLDLSNEDQSIAADAAGTVLSGGFAGAVSTATVYIGANDTSAEWAFTITPVGVTGTPSNPSGLNGSARSFTVSALPGDTGYVDFTATRSGYATVSNRFTLSKVRAGAAGLTPTVYQLEASVGAVGRSAAGAFNPATITFSAYATTGTAARTAYAGRFLIDTQTTVGGAWQTSGAGWYASTVDQSSYTFTLPANVVSVRARLCPAGAVPTSATTALDQETIPVVTDGAAGAPGANGLNGSRTAVLDLYQWAATAPTVFPSGTSTYTWATGQFTAPTTSNGWSLTPPAAVLGQTLWVARQLYADTATTATTVVNWTTASARAEGAAGSNGNRTAVLELYQWAATAPTVFPSGTSTYTWATGAFSLPSAPNSWSLTPGAPTPGQTLWSCSTTYSDTATSATSIINWTATAAYATGAAGSIGPAGPAGVAGERGSKSFVFSGTYSASSWVTATVDALITSTPGVAQGSAGVLVVNDVVTLVNPSTNYSETRFRRVTDWQSVAAYINGNLLVNGTVNANALTVGVAGNRLQNSDATNGLDNVYVWKNGNIADLEVWTEATGWAPKGGRVFALRELGINGTANTTHTASLIFWNPLTGSDWPVEAGKYYEISCKSGAHRCIVGVHFVWFDANNTVIGWAGGDTAESRNDGEKPGGTSLTSFKPIFARGQAPANAVRVRVEAFKITTKAGYTDSWLFATQFMFLEVPSNTSQPTPWAPGGMTLIGPGSVTTGTLITGSAQIGDALITDAKITNLNAAKVNFGVMSGDRIDTNTLHADRIVSGSIGQVTVISSGWYRSFTTAGNKSAGLTADGWNYFYYFKNPPGTWISLQLFFDFDAAVNQTQVRTAFEGVTGWWNAYYKGGSYLGARHLANSYAWQVNVPATGYSRLLLEAYGYSAGTMGFGNPTWIITEAKL